MSDKEFNVSPKTRTLADRIKAVQGTGVDSNNTLKDDGLFRKIATEDGRDVDQMERDDEYRSDFIAANTLAQGEIALEHKRNNKDVSTVSGVFEIGRNRMEVSFEKHQRVPNRVLDKESGAFKVDGERDLWGDATVKYKVRGTQNSKGELKAVRGFLSEGYSTAFSS
jgi:hypothetical protein